MCLVDLETGVGHCFCSMSCLYQWAKFKKFDLSSEEISWAHQNECIYCYKCGDLAVESPHCGIHDGACPRTRFDQTYGAHAICRLVYERLQRELEDSDVAAVCEAVTHRTSEDSALDLTNRALQLINEVQWDRD